MPRKHGISVRESLMSTGSIHSTKRQPCRPQHRHAGTIAAMAVLTIGLAVLGSAVPAAAQETKPNILFIMGDDIGWMQVVSYQQGLGLGETPNIDRIGNEGARFVSYYADQTSTAGRTAFFPGMPPLPTGMIPPQLPGSP